MANRPQHSKGHAHFVELVEDRSPRDPDSLGDIEKAIALHAESLDRMAEHELWADQDSESEEDIVEAFYVSEDGAYSFLQESGDPKEIFDIYDGEETDGLPVLKVFKGQPFRKKFLRGRRSDPKEHKRRRTQFKVKASVFCSSRRQPRREKEFAGLSRRQILPQQGL